MKKIATYVLIISERFPNKMHNKVGQQTNFYQKILRNIKKHTIRGNYTLWRKRFKKIDEGEACLSVRQWEGVPYRSKQIELIVFHKTNGIGIEKLEDPRNLILASIEGKEIAWGTVAENDGLDFTDFQEWFKNSPNKPMAIIHFTNFRYNQNKI